MRKILAILLVPLACLAFKQANAQGYEIRNLKTDFGAVGDGVHDDSPSFEQASAFFNTRHGYGKLVIPDGTYRVGLQLTDNQKPSYVTAPYYLYGMYMLNINSCSHLTIEGGNNTVIKYRDRLRYGTFEADGSPCTSNCYSNTAKTASIGSFFNIVDSDSLTIKNLELDGNNLNFVLGSPNQPDGYQIDNDGIDISGGSHDIAITSVNAHHFGRDGIQIVNTTPNGIYSASNNIVLRSCAFEYNGRQGLSWVGGKGLSAYNCKFNHTGQGALASNPGAGIDFEPESGTLYGGHFDTCEFNQNINYGIISDGGISPGAYCGEMHFDRSYFQGNGNRSILVRGRENFFFANCHVAGSVLYSSIVGPADAIKFINTSFTDEFNGQALINGAALLEFPYYGDCTPNNASMANYAYFNACQFTARHQMLMYVENTPSCPGNCASYDPSKFIVMQGGSLRYNPATTPNPIVYARGVNFMGYWSMGTTATSPISNTFSWRDILFQGEGGTGISTLQASSTTYNIGCPGVIVGANDQDQEDVIVEAGNTLFVDSEGQLSLRKKGSITLKAGATLFINQNAQLFLHGKIRVEDGATISIHPTVRLYADPCEDELYIAPGATVQGRTDFSGTNINVTGGHAGLITGGNCAPSGNQRLVSVLATSSSAKQELAVAYPNPFQRDVTLSLPASKSAAYLTLVDAQGREVYKQQVAAGVTSVVVGRELAAGLYVMLLQSVEGSTTLRVAKD